MDSFFLHMYIYIHAYVQGLLNLLSVRARKEKAQSERESFVRSNLSSDESNQLACQCAEECGPL